MKTPAEFADIVVSSGNGQIVKLERSGPRRAGSGGRSSALRYRGSPRWSLASCGSRRRTWSRWPRPCTRAAGARAGAASRRRASWHVRRSVFVQRSIQEAEETLLIAAVLVMLIIFVFLRNFRATIIPAVAIPVSIIATFAVMYFLGFSINTLTLLALILAIGIVVDDAIIVLENAYRHQEELHKDPETAAIERHARDRHRRHRHDDLAGRRLHPAGLPPGQHRPALQRVRHRGRRLGAHLRLRGAHAHADALRKDSSSPPRARPAVHDVGARLRMALPAALLDTLALVIAPPRFVVLGVVVATAIAAVVSFKRSSASSCRRKTAASSSRSSSRPKARPSNTPTTTCGRSRRSSRGTPRSRATSLVGSSAAASRRGLRADSTDWSERDRSAQEIIDEVQPQFFGVPGVFAFAINPPAFGGFAAPVQFVVRIPTSMRFGAGMDTLVARASDDSGADQRRHRPARQQARAGRDARPRSRRRSRRARPRHRDDAADTARRPRREPIHAEQQAVRRDPAARLLRSARRRPTFAGSTCAAETVSSCRSTPWRASRRQSGPRQLNHLQSRALLHALGEHGAGLHARPGARFARARRARGAAARAARSSWPASRASSARAAARCTSRSRSR